jgi:hypothetical protein
MMPSEEPVGITRTIASFDADSSAPCSTSVRTRPPGVQTNSSKSRSLLNEDKDPPGARHCRAAIC